MPTIDGFMTVLPPPEGYIVDFDHPQRQGVPHAYWVTGVGTILSLVMIAQRLYTKLVFVGRLQIDDVFLVLAWVVSLTTIALCLHMFATGSGGIHGWELPMDKLDIYMVDVYLAAAMYIVGGSLAKLSLLIFYFRLSPQTWFMVAIWSTILFISGYTISIFFALIFACNPISKSWDYRVIEGQCVNRPALYIATAAVNIASDVILFCLPIPIVFKLQIPRRQKFGLLLIFLLGSLTIVTSIVRMTILPAMLTSPDQTWVVSWATVWVLVEANLIIICASLPTLRKFLKHVAPKLVGESITRSRDKGKESGGSAPPSALRTIGMISTSDARRNRRGEYSRFDPDEDDEEQGVAVHEERSESYTLTNFATKTSTIKFPPPSFAQRGNAKAWGEDR